MEQFFRFYSKQIFFLQDIFALIFKVLLYQLFQIREPFFAVISLEAIRILSTFMVNVACSKDRF